MKGVTRFLIAVGILGALVGNTYADLSDGLVANYPFNGNASDETGNGYDGTVFGATPCDDRYSNASSAYCFDGVNDYINIGQEPDFPTWETYAVSVWFLNDNGGDHTNGYGQKIIDKTTWYSDFYLSVITHTTGELHWQTYQGGPGSIVHWEDYRDNTWHHAVLNKNGTSGELWVDGQLVGTSEVMKTVTNSQPILFGYSFSGDPYQRKYWSGKIDDVRFYSRVLSTNEIKKLYGTEAEVSVTKAAITFSNKANRDNYTIEGDIVLSQYSDGIDPVNEDVSITVGTSNLIIPAGSFSVTRQGDYWFKGKLNSSDISVKIRPVDMNAYKFTIDTKRIDLTDTANPAYVELILANDFGETTTTKLQGQVRTSGKGK